MNSTIRIGSMLAASALVFGLGVTSATAAVPRPESAVRTSCSSNTVEIVGGGYTDCFAPGSGPVALYGWGFDIYTNNTCDTIDWTGPGMSGTASEYITPSQGVLYILPDVNSKQDDKITYISVVHCVST